MRGDQMSRNKKSFDEWIFDTYSVSNEGLGLFRICGSLYILFFLIPGRGLSHYEFLSSLPNDFYLPPPGPMMLFESFPPYIVFQVIYGLIILFVIGMLVGYRTKLMSISSGIMILVMQGLIFSIGKTNHEILVALTPIIMSFTNWGNSFSVDSIRATTKKEKPESWPLVLLSLFVGFMMFTAGFPKILGGWLDPSTQAVNAHLFRQFFVHNREAFLAGYAIQFHNDFLWEILDWITILFEIGFLVAVWKAHWFRFMVMFVVFFHFSTSLLLNISFMPNFIAYAAFLNWDKIYQAIKRRVQLNGDLSPVRAEKISVFLFIGSVFAVFSILKWISLSDFISLNSDLKIHESLFLFMAIIVVTSIALNWIFEKRKNLS